MNSGTIGLDHEQRSDFDLRKIFVEAFELVAPFLTAEGNWISQIHELQAHDALSQRFPDISGVRQFAVLVSIAGVRASGRAPAD
jgi:hypothetical protein